MVLRYPLTDGPFDRQSPIWGLSQGGHPVQSLSSWELAKAITRSVCGLTEKVGYLRSRKNRGGGAQEQNFL